jgi:hypothetical protein
MGSMVHVTLLLDHWPELRESLGTSEFGARLADHLEVRWLGPPPRRTSHPALDYVHVAPMQHCSDEEIWVAGGEYGARLTTAHGWLDRARVWALDQDRQLSPDRWRDLAQAARQVARRASDLSARATALEHEARRRDADDVPL